MSSALPSALGFRGNLGFSARWKSRHSLGGDGLGGGQVVGVVDEARGVRGGHPQVLRDAGRTPYLIASV